MQFRGRRDGRLRLWPATLDRPSGRCQTTSPRSGNEFGQEDAVRKGAAAIAKSNKPKKTDDSQERVIAQNRKAQHNYAVLETLECGIVLLGSEVKSLRQGHVSLDESFARVRDGELWLLQCDIPEYKQATVFNHQPKRPRKLLIHRREFKRFALRATEKGLTLIPLRLYFHRGRLKVLLGLCRGKQQHDKRTAMKKAEAQRDIQRAMMRRR